jgi:hypothetical protein
MIKAAEILLVVIVGLPVLFAFLMLPVMALVWLPKGKLLSPLGRVVAGRGIVLRHENPIQYWLWFLIEMTFFPFVALGVTGAMISAIASIVAP